MSTRGKVLRGLLQFWCMVSVGLWGAVEVGWNAGLLGSSIVLLFWGIHERVMRRVQLRNWEQQLVRTKLWIPDGKAFEYSIADYEDYEETHRQLRRNG